MDLTGSSLWFNRVSILLVPTSILLGMTPLRMDRDVGRKAKGPPPGGYSRRVRGLFVFCVFNSSNLYF